MHWKQRINQDAQKENNLALVIRAIHNDPDCSRVRLVETVSLKQATITKIVKQLMMWGLVSETEKIDNPQTVSAGRKPVRLKLNSDKYLILSVRLNRDYLRVALFDIMGGLIQMKEVPIDAFYGARASMDRMKEMIHELVNSVDIPILGVGVALPGPFDARNNRITLMSGFPGWDQIDISGELRELLGLPIFLDHDANCGALAEQWYGHHTHDGNLLFVACDRGIGAGLIIDGRIYRGALGFAGEIGHTSIDINGPRCECGNHGCLELYGSTRAMEQEYRRVRCDPLLPSITTTPITARRILSMVRGGDAAACQVYRRTVSYLAFGLVSVINTLNPNVVVFGDPLVNGGALFLETVQQVLHSYLMKDVYDNLTIMVSGLRGDTMLLGASALVLERMLDQPSAAFGDVAESAADVWQEEPSAS
ncbi:N-acetylglucosamine repressor [Clostridia bacterium]|nr:N-acetylglucosamine repressor [Clostridia bacterium]